MYIYIHIYIYNMYCIQHIHNKYLPYHPKMLGLRLGPDKLIEAALGREVQCRVAHLIRRLGEVCQMEKTMGKLWGYLKLAVPQIQNSTMKETLMGDLPSGYVKIAIENGPVEIVDESPLKMVLFHSFLYV